MRQILLVEDSATQARAVTIPLESAGYEVVRVDRLADAVENAQHRAFDSIILDLQLPDSSGLDTYLQMQEAAHDIPIVVLTSTDDEQLALQMLRSGAQDYLIKEEVTSDWILRSVRYAMERIQAGRQQREKESVAVEIRQLELDVEEINDVTVIRIRCNQLMGSDVISELSSQLYKLVDEAGKKKFVLNCHDVDYVSNSVLGKLLIWDQKIRQNGGSMRICKLRRHVMDQIKVRKLLAQFDICIDEDTALRGF